MIYWKKGNLLESDCDYICQQVNCQGKMNSGIAKQIREKWPVVYQNYKAKYEADMKKIDMKDRRYDTELAALDGERNAIKSEMETLKTVAKDNVERTFKLFS